MWRWPQNKHGLPQPCPAVSTLVFARCALWGPSAGDGQTGNQGLSGLQRILQTKGSFLDTQAVLKVTYLLALQGSRRELESDINGENTQSCGG